MGLTDKTPEALMAELAKLPEVVGGLVSEMRTHREAAGVRLTEAERRQKDVEDKLLAAETKLAEIAKSQRDGAFSLPGAEELVKTGKLRLGHFIVCRAVQDFMGEAQARRLFPLVFDVHEQTLKRLGTAAQERAFGGERTQVTHDDALGGYLVPEEVAPNIVAFPYAQTCLGKLNAVNIPNCRGGQFRVRKLTGSGTVTMTGETPGAAVTKTSIAFGRATLSPRKAMALAAISRELDELSNPNALAALEDDLRTKMGLKMEQQLIEGTGGEFQVRGLDKYTLAADGVKTFDATGTDSGALTAQANGRDLTDYIMRRVRNIIEAAEGLSMGGKMHYIMPTLMKQVLALQQLTFVASQKPDSGSSPMFGAGIVDDARLEAMYGPLCHSTQFSTSRTIGGSSDGGLLIGGDFRNYYICQWGGLLVSKFDQGVLSSAAGAVTLNAVQDEALLIRVTGSFDAAHVRPSDICLATGLRTVRSGV